MSKPILNPQYPPIVLITFGTTVLKARQVYDYIEQCIKARYPKHQIVWGFTSGKIREKLRKQGMTTYSPDEAIAQLQAQGWQQAVMQSLHVVPGQEFEKLQQIKPNEMEIAVGAPLMSTDADIDAVIEILTTEFQSDRGNIIVCHGNSKHAHFNQQNITLAKRIRQQFPHVFVASVEGAVEITDINSAKTAVTDGKVHFIPLMMVAGDHILNDVLGDEEDSWKNQLGATTCTCAEALGYNDKIINLFFKHLDNALAKLTIQS
jgi:sirohydrochlorin cobaltochelatase